MRHVNYAMYAITGNKIFNHPAHDTVIIDGDRIYDVTNLSQLTPNIEVKTFDNAYILPGFWDTHVHVVTTGVMMIYPNLKPATCIDDVLSILSMNLHHEPLIAYGLAPHRLREKRYPTTRELDTVSRTQSIIVIREDLHSCVMNTVARKRLGITSTADVLRGEEFEPIWHKIQSSMGDDIIAQAIKLTCNHAINQGVTTICGLFSNLREYEIYDKLKDDLPIDVIPYVQTRDVESIVKLGLPRIGGCILVDGSISSHTAAMDTPYHDSDTCGVLYFTDDELLQFVRKAAETGLQVAMHAIGERAIRQLLDTYKKVPQHRHRIEHAECITDEQIEQVARHGIVLSMQPAFEGVFHNLYVERLGYSKAMNMNPFRKVFDRNIKVGFGSDSPVTNIDPLFGIKCATHHPNPELSISYDEAILGFTEYPAYACFMETEYGKLAPGYVADITVVDMGMNKILAVIKRGQIVLKQEQPA